MKTLIHVNLDFEGFHFYEGAPDEVKFLKYVHRHIFNVSAKLTVYHDDRELEFIMVKKDIAKHIDETYPDKVVGSCEMVATELVNYLKKRYGSDRYVEVGVYEDKENGAIVSS